MPPIAWLACLIYGSIGAFYAKQRSKNPFFWFTICFTLGLGALIAFILHPHIKKMFKKDQKEVPKDVLKAPVIKTPTFSTFSPDTIWYYLDKDDNQNGPMSLKKIQALQEENIIHSDIYIWTEAFSQWKQWKNIFPPS